MADNSANYEAMVIPKGARIIAGDGAEIELDVQGDLILQESQEGLTALKSHHGSILIDENVHVRSRAINARHMIRVRGRLETDDISSENIRVEGGMVHCDTISTKKLECSDGKIETSTIRADQVSIKGGNVEIGSINAETISLKDRVRGSILISSAKKRDIDETVSIKGGFESDVELLGYLLKYRHQVMSNRVLEELKSRKEGREFKRFLVGGEAEEEPATFETSHAVDALEAEAERIEAEVEAEVTEEPVEEAIEETVEETAAVEETVAGEEPEEPADLEEQEDPFETAESAVEQPGDKKDIKSKLQEYGQQLQPLLPDAESQSALIKLIQASLRQGDVHTLMAIFQRWSSNLDEELKSLNEDTRSAILEIREFLYTVS
jgi:cytoskeletal protein CcmA (bactofilin family)